MDFCSILHGLQIAEYSDIAIVEDYLTFIVYGQGYFIDNISYQTQTGIQIRPYDSKRDFIFLNISKDIVL